MEYVLSPSGETGLNLICGRITQGRYAVNRDVKT